MDYPGFGLTSLLDAEPSTLPPGIEATYPTIGAASVAVAADALARLLRTAGRHAVPAVDTPLAEYVTARLAATAQQVAARPG